MSYIVYIIIGAVVLFLLVGLSIASFAGAQFEDTFKKYNHVPAMIKMTGGQLALSLRQVYFNSSKLEIARCSGELCDAYSTRSKTVILSDSTCDVASVAALAVVAHEMGHAMQDQENTGKYVLNRRLAKTTHFLGYLMLPLLLVGLFLCVILPNLLIVGLVLMGISVIIFLLALFLKISTIRVEKDASKRALKILAENEILDEEEIVMAKNLLKAALLTYIADFLRVILAWTMLTRKTKLFY